MSLVAFVQSLPAKSKITHATINMWGSYRIAVGQVLPNAKIVVNKFDVASKTNAALEDVRRNITKAKKKHSLRLKRSHKPFAKRSADWDDAQYPKVSGWHNSFPLLASAYSL